MNRLWIIHMGLFLLISVFSLCPAVYADFRSPQNVIMQSETDDPTCVYAADLDGDGDLDILSASEGYYWSAGENQGYNDCKIAWYENDGSGQFGSQKVITTSANIALVVKAGIKWPLSAPVAL